jgi:hypothetical protein
MFPAVIADLYTRQIKKRYIATHFQFPPTPTKYLRFDLATAIAPTEEE